MYYIEKNDKPSILDNLFCRIKIEGNKLLLPNFQKLNKKKNLKISKKLNKILERTNSNKIVLSKEIHENIELENQLNSYGYYVVDGKILFEILVNDILNIMIIKKNMKKKEIQISILVNSLSDYVLENIKILANEYKSINIVTNHIEKFKKIEEKIYDEYGLVLTVTNNKKKSLAKSKLIVNIDFPNELINKYYIFEEAIVLDIRGDVKINKKRFNGIIIKDYEIQTSLIEENNKYYTKELYEAKLYPNMNYNEIISRIKNDKVKVYALLGCNGEIL